uniref:Uncharacterized protein n=1 Tax=Cacopsylla melanoneura TaxID=428564 RepID=A0A8D8YMG4_9HEMI
MQNYWHACWTTRMSSSLATARTCFNRPSGSHFPTSDSSRSSPTCARHMFKSLPVVESKQTSRPSSRRAKHSSVSRSTSTRSMTASVDKKYCGYPNYSRMISS